MQFYRQVLARVSFSGFVRAIKMASNYHATAMVDTPLNSITEELQIREANRLKILAASLTKLSAVELKSADFRLLYGSAENVLDGKFLDAM